MTPSQFDTAKAICDAATPAPWPDVIPPGATHRRAYNLDPEDANFCYWARDLLPMALAKIESLEVELAEQFDNDAEAIELLQEEVDGWREHFAPFTLAEIVERSQQAAIVAALPDEEKRRATKEIYGLDWDEAAKRGETFVRVAVELSAARSKIEQLEAENARLRARIDRDVNA